MTAPTNTYVTTGVVGNREDLSNAIYRITPTVTPLQAGISKVKATNTLHEWQTQDLAAAANNAQAEGDDATFKVVTPRARLNNRTQVSTKSVVVSGSQRAMNPAGVKDELANQVTLMGLELRRDMEVALCQNQVTGTSPRQARGLTGWIVDNTSTGTGTTLASYTGNTGTTDGTQRPFTEASMKAVLQLQWAAGGEPDTIMLGGSAKQTFSTFTGNATRLDKSEDSKLYASIEVYESDFGTLKAVPNRFQRSRDVFILQMDKLALAVLRPIELEELAKTGDSDKRMLVTEYTLECRAPKAHGAVYDIQ